MASCLITIGGTSGGVIINYTLGGNALSMNGGFGQSLYINDTATDITYTTTSGDATASSGCVTITDLPYECYILNWETRDITFRTQAYPLKFDTIYLDAEDLAIPLSEYDRHNLEGLAININELGDARIKAIAGKTVQAPLRGSFNHYLLVRVQGAMIPKLRILNVDTDLPRAAHYGYVEGVVQADCSIDVDFTTYDICDYTAPAP